jgi:hypothetical protein
LGLQNQFPVSDEEFAGKKSVTAFVVFCLKSSVICVLQVASAENKNGRRFFRSDCLTNATTYLRFIINIQVNVKKMK